MSDSADPNPNNQTETNEAAYRRHLPEFQALTPEELVNVNLDIPTAVTIVLGSLPEILTLLPEMAELPKFDVSRTRNLESYAWALSHANTLYLVATQPPDSLQPLLEEATKLRELLLSDGNALVARGLLNGKQLKDLKGPIGYKNLAVDLDILVTTFREGFAQVEGKCATTRNELERAEQLSRGIMRAVGLKEQGTALIAETADIRTRALTLLLRVYDSAQRAITYLRWKEKDVHSIAPSLYSGRGVARKKTATDGANAAKPPATPSVPSGGAAAPGPSSSTVVGSQPVPAVPSGPREPFLS